MKNSKILIFLFIILIVVGTFFACDSDKILDTPSNVAITEQGLITFDKVEHATSYEITIGDATYTTDTESYQVEDLTKDFTFTVIAKAEGYKDSVATEAVSFTAKTTPTPTPTPTPTKINVGIKGSSEVKTGKTAKYSATVDGVTSTEVTWSVREGKDYVEISADGTLTAKSVDGDKIVKIVATSTIDSTAKAEKVITIVAKPVLTQSMLDVFNNVDKMAFEGYLSLSVYSTGIVQDLQKTYTSVIKTSMDKNGHWYAEYEDASTGITQGLYYTNHGGVACQTGLSLTNDEKYEPMTDSQGNSVSWQDAGLYNNLKNLSVSDFEFDEETWRYVYKNKNSDLVKKVIAMSNPYDFITDTFGLIIDGGEIMGLYSKAYPDETIVSGYSTIQELFVAVTTSSTVEVPTIPTYTFDPEVHTLLKNALDNMQALTSYTLDFNELSYYLVSSTYSKVGFIETVTPTDCYYVPYETTSDAYGNEVKKKSPGDAYGYHKVSDTLYNSFAMDKDGTYSANRAFQDAFSSAKPSFAFAPEIFRSYIKDEENGTTTYYVESIMANVATTYYYGVGNSDKNLYGIYATTGYVDSQPYLPYVTVKEVDGKPYITEAGFYFYMGSLYGFITVNYSDFNTATLSAVLPEGTTAVNFETRLVPSDWSSEYTKIIASDDGTATSEDYEVSANAYLTEFFGGEKFTTTSDVTETGKVSWTAVDGALFYVVKITEKPATTTATAKTTVEVVKDALTFESGITQDKIQEISVVAYKTDKSNMLPFFGSVLGDTYGFCLSGMRIRDGKTSATSVLQFYYDVPLDVDYSIESSLRKVKQQLLDNGFVQNAKGEYIKNGVIVQPMDVSLDFIIYVWYDPTETV